MSSLFEQLAELTPEQRAQFEKRLAERGVVTSQQSHAISARDTSKETPLSFAQQRLWFVQQFDSNNSAYNAGSALRLRGPLNVNALNQALTKIIERHESLRTAFVRAKNGQPEQRILNPSQINLEALDASMDINNESGLDLVIQKVLQEPFDLSKPPLRLALYKLNDADHLFIIVTHHIISDRWSVMVFLRELTLLYRSIVSNAKIELPALPIQYADWSVWQRQQLTGVKLSKLLAYWHEQLKNPLPYLELPTDFTLPAIASHQGAQLPFQLDTDLSNQLKTLASNYQVSLFSLLLSAYKTLLYRYTNSVDIVVGSEVANRDKSETTGLIGPLVNTLVLRSDLSGNPKFSELLKRVHQTVVDGLEHQQLPFEKLVEELNPDRQLDQLTPLFQAKFDLQQLSLDRYQFDELELQRYPVEETQTKNPLRFNLQDSEKSIYGQIEYSTDLFLAESISRIAEHYKVLLGAIVESPHNHLLDLPILNEAEQSFVIKGCNGSEVNHPSGTLQKLFTTQAERTPNAVAVSDQQNDFSYAQLDLASDQLAKGLLKRGIKLESTVGVCMERGFNLIVALLGILKAGAAYVPLDPAYPARRLAHIVDDAEIDILISDASLPEFSSQRDFKIIDVEQIINDSASSISLPVIKDKNLAYVIYTSGSTGLPKGVAIEHRNAVAMLHWARAQYDDASLSGVFAATSICFDLSIFEIFVPLAWGGRIILAENLLSLANHRAHDEVTLLNTVPSLLSQYMSNHTLPNAVNTINLAGEALPVNQVRTLQKNPNIKHLYNLYGPSEDTTYSTFAPLTAQHFDPDTMRVPIGKPVENTHAYVVDSNLQPVPIGVAGELLLGGDGIARGYLGKAELTAERFINNPIHSSPAKVYRTGDMVVRRANGQLEFLGRFDHQYKIRGYRIEAGEIETALGSHETITEALVSTFENEQGEQHLLAYVATNKSLNAPSPSTLRAYLSEQLPSPMIPTMWYFLYELPRLPNGKVDRQSLPKPSETKYKKQYVAPKSDTEKVLVEIWQALLKQERIGIEDDFFALGGHSLLAIELITQIEQKLNRTIALRSLFLAPTIAALAPIVENEADSTIHTNTRPTIEIDAENAHHAFPLTDIQQAYWLGRSGAFELGNIATHGYREIDVTGLEPSLINHALNQLIKRHGMLRAIVESDGTQRILNQVDEFEISISDLCNLTDNERDLAVSAIRERLSHQIFNLNQWPLFHIEAARISSNQVRYFVSFDVIIGDAWSLQILGRDMARLLSGERLSKLSLSFRDYVLAEHAYKNSPEYEASLNYWQSQLDSMPAAPELPLYKSPAEIEQPRFQRRSWKLPKTQWQQLRKRISQAGLSPSSVVLTAFSEILAKWSRCRDFTINLTLFNRYPCHPQVNQIIGDFTSSLLLSFKGSDEISFTERARRVQTQLWESLEHRAVSGVHVQRQLASMNDHSGGALMPVVFTSTLGQDSSSLRPGSWQAEVNYALSQTSQVYLDHQVSEIDGELCINWDAIDDLFPTGVLDEMFNAYTHLIQSLANNDQTWLTSVILPQINYLTELNGKTEFKIKTDNELLHEAFFIQAAKQANNIAIINDDVRLSYAELARYVIDLSKQLQQNNCAANELIAISLDKGWYQIVATLAVLTAGSAYVPIDPSLPRKRRKDLMNDTGAKILISDSDDWPDNITRIPPASVNEKPDSKNNEYNFQTCHANSDDLAYVIYTSGSTGMPKGVMIDHRGAVNTIKDVNQRVNLNSDDCVLALSSLSFDLSVYDIFGTLSAGACIVIPNASKRHDPAHWLELIVKHKVSIWNSVPALFQLLLEEYQRAIPDSNPPIRSAMLSGDWIPLSLPSTLASAMPNVELISMGGATEASIWSIWYYVEALLPEWKSVPYGTPLNNQTWYILDEQHKPCPPWVTGDLYIGGSGLARGYWKRPELTAESFIPNPLAHGKNKCLDPVLYKTGDIGRYHPENWIEFLGREDAQVKISGHRIELGEIEHCLSKHPAIAHAVVNSIGDPAELIAYVVPASEDNDTNKNIFARLQFKDTQHHSNEKSNSGIDLPQPDDAGFRRQSHRNYISDAIPYKNFTKLIALLAANNNSGSAIPKYQYPSAGSLYPVTVYLSVKPNRVEQMDAGWYRYDSIHHQLIKLGNNNDNIHPQDEKFYTVNLSAFESSAFSIFLVADLEAIVPIYGERSRDFCLLEAGYIGQLLMQHAADLDLGLCPINDPGFNLLDQILPLDEHRVLLHGLLGGGIDPEWSSTWAALGNNNGLSFIEQLQNHLSETLPNYMIPARFQLLKELPLSPNGKLDRSQLPKPEITSNSSYRAPESTLDQQVVDLWSRVLGQERVGMDDNFFQLGGNSLLAIQLLSGLRELGNNDLSIAQLFDSLTPASQVELLHTLPASTIEETSITRIERKQNVRTENMSDKAVDEMLNNILNSVDQENDFESS
ncbi:MAG: amino acid adenylation domain-containing protein [Pseudomonadota bacterium]